MRHDQQHDWNADAELRRLVAAMCDGTITGAECDRLQVRLANEPSAMTYYIDYLDLHAQLQWRSRGEAKPDDRPVAKTPILIRLRNAVLHPTPFSLTTAALVMGVLITGLAFITLPANRAARRTGAGAEQTTVAEVTRTSSAVWKPERTSEATAQFLLPGVELELVSGLAEIQFYRGTRVILEGPAVLRVVGDNAAALDRGRLVARVESSAHGFEIRTPVARVRDLGTEFALSVAKLGATNLHVFQGRVEVLPAETGAKDETNYLVVAGEQLEIPAAGAAVRGVSQNADAQFVRRMPLQGSELRISPDYVQAIRDAKPAIYWRFEDANDGRVANEMSPEHALQVVGGVRLLPSDDANHSAVFGGSKQAHYMICRDVDVLSGPEYSVELWCLPYTHHPQMLTMVGLGRGEVVDSFLLALMGNGRNATATGRVRYLHRSRPSSTGGTDLYSAAAVEVGQWHHVVSVYENSAMRLYLNGELVESKAAAPLHADAKLLLLGAMRTAASDARPFIGRLDEIAIYERALNETEVRQHRQLVPKK